ncbi:MAG: hypothetical protein ACOCV8_05625 [Spirochaetota bacterium]
MYPYTEIHPDHKIKTYLKLKANKILEKRKDNRDKELTNYEESIRNFFLDLYELDEIMHNLYDFRYYFGTFRFSDKNISKYRYLRKNILDYNNMLYLFHERIKRMLNKLKKTIFHDIKENEQYENYYKNTIRKFLNALEGVKKRRGSIAHDTSIETKNLVDIGSLEALLDSENIMDLNQNQLKSFSDEIFRKERKIYKSMAVNEYKDLLEYMKSLYDFLADILLDKELIYTFNINGYGNKNAQ